MKAKLEWYEEILALEPGSKVFFPYARCLVDAGMTERALHVLQQGVELHPEYVEARIFLTHLLYTVEAHDKYTEELEHIIEMLTKYPGFWDAWSKHVPANDDTALVLQLLASSLRNGGIRLIDLLQKGLTGVESSAKPCACASDTGSVSVPLVTSQSEESESVTNDISTSYVATPVVEEAVVDVPAVEDFAATETPVAEVSGVVEDASFGEEASSLEHEDAFAAEPNVVTDDDADAISFDADETEASPSLCTRSMAEILTDQGDLQGAMDIYGQLLARAVGDEAAEIQKCVDALQQQMEKEGIGGANNAKQDLVITSEKTEKKAVSAKKTVVEERPADVEESLPPVEEQPEENTSENNGELVSILENLADRLEKRAQG